MSQVSHPSISGSAQLRPHRTVVLSGLLALVAATAVFLVLAFGDDPPSSSQGSGTAQSQPSARADGGPDESRVAAAVGTRAAPIITRPDESRTAAAISGR